MMLIYFWVAFLAALPSLHGEINFALRLINEKQLIYGDSLRVEISVSFLGESVAEPTVAIRFPGNLKFAILTVGSTICNNGNACENEEIQKRGDEHIVEIPPFFYGTQLFEWYKEITMVQKGISSQESINATCHLQFSDVWLHDIEQDTEFIIAALKYRTPIFAGQIANNSDLTEKLDGDYFTLTPTNVSFFFDGKEAINGSTGATYAVESRIGIDRRVIKALIKLLVPTGLTIKRASYELDWTDQKGGTALLPVQINNEISFPLDFKTASSDSEWCVGNWCTVKLIAVVQPSNRDDVITEYEYQQMSFKAIVLYGPYLEARFDSDTFLAMMPPRQSAISAIGESNPDDMKSINSTVANQSIIAALGQTTSARPIVAESETVATSAIPSDVVYNEDENVMEYNFDNLLGIGLMLIPVGNASIPVPSSDINTQGEENGKIVTPEEIRQPVDDGNGNITSDVIDVIEEGKQEGAISSSPPSESKNETSLQLETSVIEPVDDTSSINQSISSEGNYTAASSLGDLDAALNVTANTSNISAENVQSEAAATPSAIDALNVVEGVQTVENETDDSSSMEDSYDEWESDDEFEGMAQTGHPPTQVLVNSSNLTEPQITDGSSGVTTNDTAAVIDGLQNSESYNSTDASNVGPMTSPNTAVDTAVNVTSNVSFGPVQSEAAATPSAIDVLNVVEGIQTVENETDDSSSMEDSYDEWESDDEFEGMAQTGHPPTQVLVNSSNLTEPQIMDGSSGVTTNDTTAVIDGLQNSEINNSTNATDFGAMGPPNITLNTSTAEVEQSLQSMNIESSQPDQDIISNTSVSIVGPGANSNESNQNLEPSITDQANVADNMTPTANGLLNSTDSIVEEGTNSSNQANQIETPGIDNQATVTDGTNENMDNEISITNGAPEIPDSENEEVLEIVTSTNETTVDTTNKNTSVDTGTDTTLSVTGPLTTPESANGLQDLEILTSRNETIPDSSNGNTSFQMVNSSSALEGSAEWHSDIQTNAPVINDSHQDETDDFVTPPSFTETNDTETDEENPPNGEGVSQLGPRVAGLCPDTWWTIKPPVDDKCYKFSNLRLPFTEAEDHCRGMGAHLPSLRSIYSLVNFLTFWKNSIDAKEVWIGLHKEDADEDWKWTDNVQYSYSNWCNEDPSMDWDNCTVMSKADEGNYCWSKKHCSQEFYFFCAERTTNEQSARWWWKR